MSSRILFVDDDESILAAFQRTLRKQFEVDVAAGADLALAKLETSPPYAVVVVDMQMPDMDGIELLKEIQGRYPDTVRMMLTGNADQKTAVQAVNEGHIFRFLNKPCPPDSLVTALRSGLRQYQLVTAERELLEQTLHGAIRSLSEILRFVHPRLAATSDDHRDLIRRLGRQYCPDDIWAIDVAAMLANVGLLALPPAVTLKSSAGMVLNESERQHLNRISETSAKVVACIPRLDVVSKIILYSRKDFDGAGFPSDDVAGEALPVGARILRVVNDYLQHRQRGIASPDALERMRLSAGVYDPEILRHLRETVANLGSLPLSVSPTASASAAFPSRSSCTVPSSPSASVAPRRPEVGDTHGTPPSAGRTSAPAAPTPNSPPATTTLRRISDALRILVIDDKAAIPEQIRRGLAPHASWTVDGCADAAETLNHCRTATPDVIVLSLSLALGRSLELFQSLRSNPSTATTPVIALCLRTANENHGEALDHGFAAIVHKPIEIRTLETKLIHVLNLDTSEKYFATRQNHLVITLPPVVDPSVVTEIQLHLAPQLTNAVDSGLTRLILDYTPVLQPDFASTQLGIQIAREGNEVGLSIRIVGTETLAKECLKYEDTIHWDILPSLDEALGVPVEATR